MFVDAGPGGASIRAVSQKSCAEIRSWSENFNLGGKSRRVRTILIEVGSSQRKFIALFNTHRILLL